MDGFSSVSSRSGSLCVACVGPEVASDSPLIILEFEQLVGCPVHSVDLQVFAVAQGWDCEGENSGWELASGLLDGVVAAVEGKTLLEVLATESTDDHDCFSVILGCSETLAGLDWVLVSSKVPDFNNLPLGAQVLDRLLDIKPLDPVHVATSLVGDAAKNIHKLVIKFATCMVVSSMGHLGEERPLVAAAVIQLALPGRPVYLFAGASHNDVAIGEGARRVAVTGNFHACFWSAFEHLGLLVVHELAGLVHGSRRLVVVAPTNHVDVGLLANLDDLEVVRQGDLEIPFCLAIVDLSLEDLAIGAIVH